MVSLRIDGPVRSIKNRAEIPLPLPYIVDSLGIGHGN
jgi:hypothetical protein